MKYALLSLITCFYTLTGIAQTELVAFESQSGRDKFWGFMSPAGEVVIDAQYIDAHSFTTGGTAMVRKQDGTWKMINRSNEVVKLPFAEFTPKKVMKFAFRSFAEQGQLLVIDVKKKEACIDVKGAVVFNAEWDRISEFEGDYAIGEKDGGYFLLKRDGSTTKINADATHVSYLKNGYAPFRNKKKLFGFINEQGDVAIEPAYNKVGYFYNGIAWARTVDGKIGFINTKGEMVIEPQFDKVSDFDREDQIVTAEKGEEIHFVDPSGKTFTVAGATGAGEFMDGLCWVRVAEKIGFINTTGQWVIEPTYEAAKNFENGIARVKKNGFWGLIDTKGKSLMDCKYSRMDEANEGLISFRNQSGLWGFADPTGAIVIEPQFANIRAFKNGYAAVRVDSLWGLIDKKGTLTIQPVHLRLKDVEVFN